MTVRGPSLLGLALIAAMTAGCGGALIPHADADQPELELLSEEEAAPIIADRIRECESVYGDGAANCAWDPNVRIAASRDRSDIYHVTCGGTSTAKVNDVVIELPFWPCPSEDS